MPLTPDEQKAILDIITNALTEFSQAPPPQTIPETIVPAGGDLQAALNAGGVVNGSGATFAGAFTLKSGTELKNCSINGPSTVPAIDIPPDTHDVKITDVAVNSAHTQRAILVGRNDSDQTSTDKAPTGVVLTRVKIPTYRGKHAIEWSGSGSIIDCEVLDAWNSWGQDSQALGITSNSPGNTLVQGGRYSAGSEVILVGGSEPATKGNVPKNLTFDGVTLFRPLSWQTDGTNRYVKNLFELKTGQNVALRNSTLSGCWQASQNGYAVVITPHSGGDIHDVLIENNAISEVGAGFQILGQEYAIGELVTPKPTSGIVIRGNSVTTSRQYAPTLSILAGITGAPVDVTFDQNSVTLDGTRIVAYDPGTVLSADGQSTKAAGPMTTFVFTANHVTGGMTYTFIFNGLPYGQPSPGGVTNLTIADNSFVGAPAALTKYQPNNDFL